MNSSRVSDLPSTAAEKNKPNVILKKEKHNFLNYLCIYINKYIHIYIHKYIYIYIIYNDDKIVQE